jgi:hypothetical protein
MSQPFIFITTHNVKDGHLDDLRNLTTEFVGFVEAEEPRLIGVHAYLNETGTRFSPGGERLRSGDVIGDQMRRPAPRRSPAQRAADLLRRVQQRRGQSCPRGFAPARRLSPRDRATVRRLLRSTAP